jgi:hypothetical protein
MKKLKDLNVPLEELYLALDKQIIIHLSDKPYTFHVVLRGRDNKPDCKISSFGANLFLRTNKGVNSEKYNSLSTLQTSLVKLIKNYVETSGTISFSISKDVLTL